MLVSLLANMLPIYISIGLGFIAGKFHKVDTGSIASLMFFIIGPIVMFSGPTRTPYASHLITAPLVVFMVGSICCAITYVLAGKWWDGENRNILAMASGSCNAGYVGLPIAMLVFDPDMVGIYIVTSFGIAIYENTVALVVMTNNQGMSASDTLKTSLTRIIKLPTLYAFTLGCLFSYWSLQIPDVMSNYIQNVRGCYAILGILQIGLGLSRIQHFAVDWKFTAGAFLAKFVLYPVVMGLFIGIDYLLLHCFPTRIYSVFMLLSLMPLASNTITIATLFDISPAKVAGTVTLSIIFASLYVPFLAVLLLPTQH